MTKVKSENIEGAAINAVLSEKNVGSTCIAAQTNEEVSMISCYVNGKWNRCIKNSIFNEF